MLLDQVLDCLFFLVYFVPNHDRSFIVLLGPSCLVIAALLVHGEFGNNHAHCSM